MRVWNQEIGVKSQEIRAKNQDKNIPYLTVAVLILISYFLSLLKSPSVLPTGLVGENLGPLVGKRRVHSTPFPLERSGLSLIAIFIFFDQFGRDVSAGQDGVDIFGFGEAFQAHQHHPALIAIGK